VKLTATVSPSNASNKNVAWSSGNAKIAAVSGSGVVTAKSAGVVKVTVKTADGGKTATTSVTVSKVAASTLAISGVNKVPNPLTKGRAVTVTGNVKSNHVITNVTAKITSANGGKIKCGTSDPCGKSKNPNAYTFNVHAWDNDLKFSKLSAGTYTYTVTATDASGKKVSSKSVTFTVKNPSSAKPAVSELLKLKATEVPLGSRMKWLFPDGTPTSSKEMQKYLTTITIPIEGGKTKKLTVHKKLAGEFLAVFKELRDIGFPVRNKDTAAYNWRKMASNPNRQSYHSYGGVVDVNWQANPAAYSEWKECRFKDWPCTKYSVTSKVVNTWKKHGFFWGGRWSAGYRDYMHFTYTNN
jgi:hypothetical protein